MDKAVFNAEKLSRDTSRLSRVQIMHIRDCARALVKKHLPIMDDEQDAPSTNEEFSKEYRGISRALGTECESEEYGIDELTEFVNTSGKAFANACRVLLCRYIWEGALYTNHRLKPETFFRRELGSDDMRIAYVKNAYSDEAYRIISSSLPNTSVVYPESFSSACEEVYNNQAGFCILPYETSEDGALSGFRQLISKYELVQIMSCSVSSDTPIGTKITRFALLSKGLRSTIMPKNAPRFLKITVDSPENTLLSDIYCASELNGLKFVKSESVPVEWDAERYSCSLTFSLGQADPVPFLLYLALEIPQSTADSIYCVI